MRGSAPDLDRVAEIIEELDRFRLARSQGPSSQLTIFGNMVMLLHAAGNPAAAIAIENAWDTLTRGRQFLSLCAYAGSCFHGSVPELLSDSRAAHGALSHAREV
jgi:hypothetical protein